MPITLQYGNITTATRTALTTTAGGNGRVSTSQFIVGNSSYTNFSGDGFISVANSPTLALGTGNFTIEGWFYLTSYGSSASLCYDGRIADSTIAPVLAVDGSNLGYAVQNSYYIQTAKPALNTWTNVAVVRNGSTTTMYVGGNSVGSFTDNFNYVAPGPFIIGQRYNGGIFPFIGFIDEFRISNSARYTANYTPSTTAFVNDANTRLLLHMEGANGSTSFPDDNIGVAATGGITLQYGNIPVATRTAITTTSVNSAQVSNAEFVFGNGSALFSSVNSAITVPNTGGVLNLGTADFTIEFRYRPISKPTAFPQIVFGNYTGAMGANNWAISDRETAANKFAFVVPNFGGNNIPLLSTTTPVNGNWYAVAVTRSGSTLRMFVDGVLEASQTFAGSIDGNSNATRAIGTSGSGTNAYINGYVDELRFSNIARYTANYTIATQPFTNDANTTLLLHMDGANASTSFPDDNIGVSPTGGITLQYENINPFWYDLTKEQVSSAISTWAPNAAPTVTTFGTITGASQWGGFTAAPNNLLYAAPFSNTAGVLIVDPSNNTQSTNSFGLSFSGSNKYLAGGALAPNGKIYWAPSSTNAFLVVDTVTNTASFQTFGLTLSGADQFAWCVLGRDGKIYAGGGSRPNIVIVDPVANTATTTTYGLAAINNSTANKWRGAKVSLNDNKIYCAPYATSNWLVIDTTNQTATTTTFGLAVGGQQHQGITNTKDGKLISSPHNVAVWSIVNPATNTGVTYSQTGTTIGIALGTDGKVYSGPFGGTTALRIYDPVANTVSTGATTATGLWGGTMAFNGKIYFTQWNGSGTILCLDTGGTGNQTTNLADLALTCYLNGIV
jgi:hypothetical protein